MSNDKKEDKKEEEKKREAKDCPRLPTKQTNPLIAGVLAFLIPGLGHAYLGQTKKAIVFFTVLVSIYIAGGLMGNFNNYSLKSIEFKHPGSSQEYSISLKEFKEEYSLTFWFHIGNGLLTGLAILIGNMQETSSYSFAYMTGICYASVSGLLNFLLIYDAIELSFLGSKKLSEKGSG